MTNRFVSFLKKAGQILSAGLPIAADVFPILAPIANLMVPAGSQATAVKVETVTQSEIALMSASVFAAEKMGNVLTDKTITGADKAKVAGADIFQIILNSVAMAGKPIADPAAAQTAAVGMAGNLADFWNAVDGAKLPSVPAPAPAPAPLPIPVAPIATPAIPAE
jgi:hypothetical protein